MKDGVKVEIGNCKGHKLKEDLGKIGREGTGWKARGRSKRVIRQVLGG